MDGQTISVNGSPFALFGLEYFSWSFGEGRNGINLRDRIK